MYNVTFANGDCQFMDNDELGRFMRTVVALGGKWAREQGWVRFWDYAGREVASAESCAG